MPNTAILIGTITALIGLATGTIGAHNGNSQLTDTVLPLDPSMTVSKMPVAIAPQRASAELEGDEARVWLEEHLISHHRGDEKFPDTGDHDHGHQGVHSHESLLSHHRGDEKFPDDGNHDHKHGVHSHHGGTLLSHHRGDEKFPDDGEHDHGHGEIQAFWGSEILLSHHRKEDKFPDTGDHDHSIEQDRLNHAKPGADVALLGSYYSLDANVEENIELQLKASTGKGTLYVQLQGSNSLSVVSRSDWVFEVGAENTFSIPATLYATENGAHALNVFTTFVDEYGNSNARAMAVSAQVGVLMVDKHHYKHESPISGESFSSLPARETIR